MRIVKDPRPGRVVHHAKCLRSYMLRALLV